MGEDKLVRTSAGHGIGGAMVLAFQDFFRRGNAAGASAILSQVDAIAKLAITGRNQALIEECRWVLDRMHCIAVHPHAGVGVLETKALAAVTRSESWDADMTAVKAAAPLGSIEGYGAVFGNVDLGGDRIIRGAFTKTLEGWRAQRRLPAMLAQHDNRQFPVGAWVDMQEDAHGLRVVGKIAATPRGQEAWNLIHLQPSALDGLSIGYTVVDAQYNGNVRELRSLDLYEISLVGLPMNTLARLDTNGKSTEPSRNLVQSFRELTKLVAEEFDDGKVVALRGSDSAKAESMLDEAIDKLRQSVRSHQC